MISKEDFKIVRDEARSFPEIKAPYNAVLIGTEELDGEVVYYYKYEGGYLYETKSGHEFKERMHRIEQNNRRKIRRKKAGA